MANGRGQLDCCYCIYWKGEYEGYDAAYEERFCKLFETAIPSTLPSWTHRICVDFEPADSFKFYAEMVSIKDRFSSFGIDLEKGVLYGFFYNMVSELTKIKNLVEKL